MFFSYLSESSLVSLMSRIGHKGTWYPYTPLGRKCMKLLVNDFPRNQLAGLKPAGDLAVECFNFLATNLQEIGVPNGLCH